MDGLKPPKALDFEGNLSEKWKLWKEGLEWYMVATKSDAKADKIKAGILLYCIGNRGKEIYNTFEFAEDGDKLMY